MAKSKGNPQIYHYLKRYQEDPTSRVFAPLAEAYRKAGLLDEAMDIARDGLRVHPNFVGGRVALARALFDKALYGEVVKELEPVVQDAPDNIVAQKLLAESYLMMGKVAQALTAYKVLLFFMPHDTEVAGLVREIESKAYDEGTLVLEQKASLTPVDTFSIRSMGDVIIEEPAEDAIQKQKKWMIKIEALQTALVNLKTHRALRLTK